MTAALFERVRSRRPRILALVDAGFAIHELDAERQPVFDAVLKGDAAKEYLVYLKQPEDVDRLAEQVKTASGMVDPALPWWIVAPFLVVVLVAAMTGVLAIPAGMFGWCLAMLQSWGKYDSARALMDRDVLNLLHITAGFLVGFGFRFCIMQRVRSMTGSPVFSIPLDFLLVAGNAALMASWISHVPAWVVAWGISAVGWGWLGGEVFFARAQNDGRRGKMPFPAAR